MITFIGGFSCTGKTLLAQKLLKEKQIPYFSVDYLKMGIFRSNPDCGFTPLDSDEHIAGYLWPIIREMAYTYIENGQDMVIEGCYILPEHVHDIGEKYRDDIKFVFVGFSEKYIQQRFETDIIKYKGIAEKREAEDERSIDVFVKGHMDLAQRAKRNNVPYYTIEEDYNGTMAGIVQRIGKN